MNSTPRIHIVIAIPAPILSAGLIACLHHIPEVQTATSEAHSYPELIEQCTRHEADIAIVSPSFGGIFNPDQFRNDTDHKTSLVALESGPIPDHTRRLFDSSISVMDGINAIADKIRTLIHDDEGAKPKDQLSQREKEVIALVVKGLTNKEIADRLFISAHTVITHRRNIARKLEIHSATGLTIYAIVNHIVDITDIKL